MNKIVDIEFAKNLKDKGFNKPCEYFYQSIDLPYSPNGLKKTKNGEKIDHNSYDTFIYSAPTIKECIDYIFGTSIKYESSVTIKFSKNIE